MTSSLPKIIAEYAKSGKSSCKKCSEKIESKALRLGLKAKDPRGYDSVKWHHFKCFSEMGSGSGCEVEAIEGFEDLKGSDQEKLKEMVSKGGHSSAKREGDDKPESDRGDLKKRKTDKDEEAGQDKKKVTDEKVMAEYAKSGKSSCKKCSEKIKFKSLRLASSSWDPRGYENTKWYHVGCFFPRDEVLPSAEIIEGFSDLKSSDQEKLKKLVSGVDPSSMETDEDEEAGQEKKTDEKVMAEYAKSGKSSCKKCSEKIKFKSFRLGSSSWDPRGYENIKWYHVGCFFPRDEGLASAEIFEGFSDLKSSHQEKLKKLVAGGDYETDEDEEAAQEKKEKIIAEYAKSGRSSCKKCSEKIESKSLRLGFSSWDPRGFENTKWHHLDCFFPLDADLVSAEAIEGFSELKSGDQERLKKLV